MNTIRILSSDDVKKLVTMQDAIETVVTAYAELSKGKIKMPIRTITDFGSEGLTLFYKPSSVASLHSTGIKLLSHRKDGSIDGHPALQGLVILIDSDNNATKAILDGAYLTALRTGAASGVATRYLARPDASVLVIFGAGAQAYTQFEAVCCERPIKKTVIFSRTEDSVKRFIEYYRGKTDVDLLPGETLDVLSEADVICTVTPSAHPLFPVGKLKKGVHINAVGSYSPTMQELPDDIFMDATLFVDHKESCFAETADIIVPLSKGLLPDENYRGELGDLITGKIEGRKTQDEITVFKNVGIAIQDLITGHFAYEKACLENMGTIVTM